jgi:hypothetical protein
MTVKRVAISQSNYIPWKGYFDLINQVDEFVLYDDMQYTRRDWRNRNLIKTSQGPLWLTIPVEVKGKYHQKICETVISSSTWRAEHWRAICLNYARAPHFSYYRPLFEELYAGNGSQLLSEVNHQFLTAICRELGITTKLSWSMDYTLVEGKTERLVALCQQLSATEYLSGPAARDYIEPSLFEQAGIKLSYIDYSGYPEYPQHYPPFEHRVSIVDLMAHTGPAAPTYIWSVTDAALSGHDNVPLGSLS